jgi:hypothetical protein
MAIFRLSAKIISRAKGQSVIASAAYRAGEKLLDPNRLRDHDYSNRHGVEHTEIMAPASAPSWLQVTRGNKEHEHEVRQELWQRVEASERKKNSQLAREILVALPHELNQSQRIELVRDFVERNFTSKGMVADVSLHAPELPGSKNYHAHILLTLREPRINGMASHKRRDWNDRKLLQHWREDWANCANRHLERAGRKERIDHRSNKDRGVAREPQPKLGPVAHEIEKAGGRSLAGDDIRAVQERNLLRDIRDLGSRAIEAIEEKLDLAQHPLAKDAALTQLERLLDEIGHRLTPELGIDGPLGTATHAAPKGLGRMADGALNAMGGVLSFFDPSPPLQPRQPAEERIAELEAFRDRLARDEHDRMRARQAEAARVAEVETDRGRERERDRHK